MTPEMIQALISLGLQSPVILVLIIWLLVTLKELTKVRAQRDDEAHQHATAYAELAERIVKAVERLDLPGPM